MDKSASAIVEHQKQIATSQKSKKKPKNNKKTSGNSSSTNSPNGISTEVAAEALVEEVAGDTMNAANGLAEKFKQHLHIAGDGLQMNGIAVAHAASAATDAEKCNSQIDSHVAQNGHYTPAHEKTMNKCTNASIAQPKQQLSMQQETTAVGAIKKSKSKSNKQQKNKEANLVYNKDNMSSHQKSDHCNDKPPPIMEAKSKSTADDAVMVQMKNGFNGCTNERADNGLPYKDVQQQQNINLTPAQQTTNSYSTLAVEGAFDPQTSTVVVVAAATTEAKVEDSVKLTTSVSIKSDAEPNREQSQTNIAPQHLKQLNDTTTTTINANPPTAKIQITNNNTAKQNDDDIDDVTQQTVANTKADTTKPEAALGDESQLSKAAATLTAIAPLDLNNVHIEYKEYESELQMHDIMRLIQAELSEPYSIYTYRYFIYNWPKLCFLAAHGNEYVGAIVCKLDMHMNLRRGYIAMLAVRKEYRKLKIGTTLVQKAIEAMLADNADEVVLETEMRNVPALRLYENLGFVRDKRLFRYYLNGVDALRLKLWFR